MRQKSWYGLYGQKKGKLPLVFVESGVKVNADYYLNSVLRKVLKPNTKILYENGDWIFQQDSAPSHKAKIYQKWLEDEIRDFFATDEWPPNSPDLNPLDYSIWERKSEFKVSFINRIFKSFYFQRMEQFNDGGGA